MQQEAAVAIVQVAPALRPDNPPALREALDQMASTAKNKELRDQAAGIAKDLPGPGRWKVLFDGHSLTGWEGNTNVWRVRDGLIVGGSLDGNPQNEFLATLTELHQCHAAPGIQAGRHGGLCE